MSFYFFLILSYLLGGIPFGLIVGFLFGHGDIRSKGSGNIGATNVWRVAGPWAALFVFIGDIGKGAAAVWICHHWYNPLWPISFEGAALLFGFFAVLGHLFSPYLKFKGGKGVNTALGVFTSLLPWETLASVIIFVVVLLVTRFVSLSSIIAALSLVGILWLKYLYFNIPIKKEYLLATSIVSVLIIFTHHKNIKRLLTGTENKFQLRRVID
ncbi:MAG: glycerol-3-phosphate 1-O-acyltransferase PlsY [candidate division Zixibacteria bacterium]